MNFDMSRFRYLSGMPRSGSTLLGSLMNQHEDVFVSSTSPVNRIMHDLYSSIQDNGLRGNDWDIDEVNARIFKYMFAGWYEHIEQKYVVDKSRGWGFNIQAVEAFIYDKPKVVVTYRSIPEIITSFLVLIENDPKNHIDAKLYKDNLEINTRNRANYIWESMREYSYDSTRIAIEQFSHIIHIVRYDDLINNTEETMNNLWEYLEIDAPVHDFNNVQNYLSNPDENWGIEGLHEIRPTIEKISKDPREVLGDELFEYYSKFNILEE